MECLRFFSRCSVLTTIFTAAMELGWTFEPRQLEQIPRRGNSYPVNCIHSVAIPSCLLNCAITGWSFVVRTCHYAATLTCRTPLHFILGQYVSFSIRTLSFQFYSQRPTGAAGVPSISPGHFRRALHLPQMMWHTRCVTSIYSSDTTFNVPM